MPKKNTFCFTDWDSVPAVMDLRLAAGLLGYSESYLRKLSNLGKFPAVRLSERKWRVEKSAIREWFKTCHKENEKRRIEAYIEQRRITSRIIRDKC